MNAEQAIREFEPMIRATINSRLGADNDREDCLQDVLLSLYLNREKFRGESSIKTFVYSITKHKIADYLRAKYRQRRIINQEIEKILKTVTESENTEAVKIIHLTRRERQVLKSLSIGMTNAEIAAELKISIHTVRSHLKNLNVKFKSNSRIKLAIFMNQFFKEVL